MKLISSFEASPALRPIATGGDTAFWFIAENKTRVRELLAREIALRSELPFGVVQLVSRAGKKSAVQIAGETDLSWQVSLSSTKACCAGALSPGREIGLDVEWIDPTFDWK